MCLNEARAARPAARAHLAHLSGRDYRPLSRFHDPEFLLAAKQLGRTFYGFDLEQEYVDIAKKLLALANGKGGRKKQKVG